MDKKTISIRLPKKHPIFEGTKAGDKMHVAMKGTRGEDTEENVGMDIDSMEPGEAAATPARKKGKGPMAYLKAKRGGMVK